MENLTPITKLQKASNELNNTNFSLTDKEKEIALTVLEALNDSKLPVARATEVLKFCSTVIQFSPVKINL